MEGNLRYPLSTASFEKIRENDNVYVDKTSYIHSLTKLEKNPYIFLARPRRFGKSLLLDTIANYFEGRRELFKGLAIDTLQPEEWEHFPVLRFNLSGGIYNSENALIDHLNVMLSRMEKTFNVECVSNAVSSRFENLVISIAEKWGKNVVILIDEYDIPFSDNIGRPELQELFREQLHGFYSVLKKVDNYTRFCMLTGVTRYGKVSVFSGINNLDDITFDDRYAGLCGITEEELHKHYDKGVKALAEKKGLTVGEAYDLLKFHYDGYHFSESLLDVYNPYSINHALEKLSIRGYWTETGAPTIFIKYLMESDYDLEELNGVRVDQSGLSNLSISTTDPIPLFFQTGYLTLKTYDEENELFTLGYPNREVETGILKNILGEYVPSKKIKIASTIADLNTCLKKGDPEGFIQYLKIYLSGIPQPLHVNVGKYENYYHTILYCLLDLVGVKVDAEFSTANGFIDLLVRTSDYIYVIELKVNGTAEDAIKQIARKQYGLQFANDSRKLYKIGLGFSKETNNIETSIVEL